jgi:hypothetical protein
VLGNLAFVLGDPEPDNYTYELANASELAPWVRGVSGADRVDVDRALAEPAADVQLAERVKRATAGHWWWSKPAPPFGKRLAWYAFARLLRPELIIETGVHDGLGALLLLRALERNAEDGATGRLVSFDINPTAGWLVGSNPLWELRIESTRTGLPALLATAAPVGLFIHDSLHTYEHERFELELAASHLAAEGVLITDNAHGTRALADVCAERGFQYSEFHERPRGHFYTGGAVGAGFRRE